MFCMFCMVTKNLVTLKRLVRSEYAMANTLFPWSLESKNSWKLLLLLHFGPMRKGGCRCLAQVLDLGQIS